MKLFISIILLISSFLLIRATPNCTAYCTSIQANCNTTNAQYADTPTCMAVCATFTVPGTDGDASGNSLACRIYHAGAAPSNASYHCPHAGPSGGGVCGKICEAYCNISLAACTGATNGFFSDYTTCYKTCLNYNSTGSYLGAGGSGANVECKVYHATAALSDAKTHCPHASPSGNGPCGSKCDNYCYTMNQICPTYYSAALPCAGFCSTIPDGNITDVGGDTKDCRIYHANNANVSGDPTHCIHATPSGGAVCGKLCDVYCGLAISICTGTLSLYNSSSACQTACTGFNSSGLPGAASGDTLQCRIYHLGAAIALANTTYHCPHGGIISAPCSSGTVVTTTTASATATATTSSSSASKTSSSTGTTSGIESLIVSMFLLVAVLLF